MRIESIAELLVRYYLNPSAVDCSVFQKVLTNEVFEQFETNRKMDNFIFQLGAEHSNDIKLWNGNTDFSKRCELTSRKRIIGILKADGFVPVCMDEKSFFIPFYLEESKTDDSSIYDFYHKKISQWESAYKECVVDEKPLNCVLFCDQTKIPNLIGNSFMLPVFLACKRFFNKLPRYDVKKIISTGAISNGSLTEVKFKEKLNRAKEYFENPLFFYPEKPSAQIENNDGLSIQLPVSKPLREVLEIIEKQIEASRAATFSLKDAIHRLVLLEQEIRYSNFSRWEFVLNRLDSVARSIPSFRKEQYLNFLMLRSAIFCHKGNPREALNLNEQAAEFALKNEMDSHYLRLKIEEIVAFQDMEDFAAIQEVEAQIKERIDSSNNLDLKMRFYGTMGRTHCFATLLGIENFSKEKAKDHFDKALECAVDLESDSDIAQDLNNMCLYHVLFRTPKNEKENAFDNARKHIHSQLLNSAPYEYKKNNLFLRYLAAEDLYRNLLATKSAQKFDATEICAPINISDSWVVALINKCLGALYASMNEFEKAKECFENALSQIKDNYNNTILMLIKMTIYAEAFRSLNDESYKKSALTIIDKLNAYKFPSIESWKNFLNFGGKFPGLKYWY